MKTYLLKMLFFTTSLCLLSCSNDETDKSDTTAIAGSYTLIAMTSNISVDLNDDGILSTDLLLETDPGFFNSDKPELEIKTGIVDKELVQLMNFYLPHPTLTSIPGSAKKVINYSRGGVGYPYTFNNVTKEISVEKDVKVSGFGRMDNIQVAGENKLGAIITKYYYDLKSFFHLSDALLI